MFEAFEGYYRPVHVKRFDNDTGCPKPRRAWRCSSARRPISCTSLPGELIGRVKTKPEDHAGAGGVGDLVARISRFPGPEKPIHDKRVREAVSLAIDRKAINEAESGGMGRVTATGSTTTSNTRIEWPQWPHDVAKAKELMAEAGHPNGFNVDWLTAVPPYFSRGERVISQLKAIGIRTRLQTMERGVYLKKLQGGLKEWPGVQIILNAARIGGSWANWYEGLFKCGGFQRPGHDLRQGARREVRAVSELVRPRRAREAGREIQRDILENYYFVPVFRHAAVNAIGPRIKAAKWQDVFPTITTAYAYPWEDIELKA